jgi:glycosyltransferase involved in cell wall biosynthesis
MNGSSMNSEKGSVKGPVMTRTASVIVCTHNRAGQLARLLAQLRRQDYPEDDYEILVVDNRSTDQTTELVREMLKEPGVPVRYIFEGRAGITWARNRGAEAARYDFLAYIDDDCTAGPEWLKRLMQGFDLDPLVEVVGGRVIVDWDGGHIPRWYGREVERSLAGTGHLGEKTRIIDKEPRVIECNMAIRKAAWRAGGGFLGMEQFGSRHCAAGEVIPLLERIGRWGGKVAFAPEAAVYHHAGKRDLRWMLARAYWQGVSDGLMDRLLDRRRGAGAVQRAAVDAAAMFLLFSLFLVSTLRFSAPRSTRQLLRAVRRFGLLVSALHLVGDWHKLRTWILAPQSYGRHFQGEEGHKERGEDDQDPKPTFAKG